MTPAWARTLAACNRRMSERRCAHGAGLSDTERPRGRGRFFRSLDEALHAGSAELRLTRARADTEIDAWAAALTEPAFATKLHDTSFVNPAPRGLPFRVAATHFFEHQTHPLGLAAAGEKR